LAPFVGGNFDSQAFSPTTVVYADEIIRQVRQFAAGFVVDDHPDPLQDIESAGPGGSFLMSEATLAQYRDVHEQHSQIWPGYALEKWLDEEEPKASEKLRKHTLDILKNLSLPEDHDELIENGERIISRI